MTDDYTDHLAGTVPLKSVLRTLRRELQAARDDALGRSLLFEVEKVEVELAIEISKKGGGKGGIEFGVPLAGKVTIEGSGERASTTSHVFRFTLAPKEKDGKPLKVTDEDEVEGKLGKG
jgi:hypothetical protein